MRCPKSIPSILVFHNIPLEFLTIYISKFEHTLKVIYWNKINFVTDSIYKKRMVKTYTSTI